MSAIRKKRRTSEEIRRDNALATLREWGIVLPAEKPLPDVPVPEDGVSHGWEPGYQMSKPRKVTSTPWAHLDGHHVGAEERYAPGRGWSQKGVALYSTPALALEAARWDALVDIAARHDAVVAALASSAP